MSSTTKERLLNDLEALRHQLEQIEAYGDDSMPAPPDMLLIPTLEVDNIPLLGDVVPANREEAIAAHLEAMASLDAELKVLDQQSKVLPKETHQAQPPADDHTAQTEPVIPSSLSSGSDLVTAHINETNSRNVDNQNANYKEVTNKEHKLFAPQKTQMSIFQEYKLATLTPVDTRLFNPISAADIGEDNPFLPQHLRERLNQSKSFLLEGIAKSSESLDASTALLKNFNGSNDANKTLKAPQKHFDNSDHNQLIDALVAKYLPIIESELRQQLSDSLKPKKTSQFTAENKTALSNS